MYVFWHGLVSGVIYDALEHPIGEVGTSDINVEA